MKCPFCYVPESKVIDSRPSDNGMSIRRRRECVSCGRKFTTYERVEDISLMVIKKDGSRSVASKLLHNNSCHLDGCVVSFQSVVESSGRVKGYSS